jgi:hypothetical protein
MWTGVETGVPTVEVTSTMNACPMGKVRFVELELPPMPQVKLEAIVELTVVVTSEVGTKK